MKTKKNLMIGALALSLLLVSTTAVFADAETPGIPGRGMGTPINASLHNYVVPIMAELFRLSEEEVAAAVDSGSTFTDLAMAAGYDIEEIPVLLQSIHTQAIEFAIQDGAITQEQANWLESTGFGTNGLRQMNGNPDGSCLNLSEGASMRRGGRW
jgi:hypothetical protein